MQAYRALKAAAAWLLRAALPGSVAEAAQDLLRPLAELAHLHNFTSAAATVAAAAAAGGPAGAAAAGSAGTAGAAAVGAGAGGGEDVCAGLGFRADWLAACISSAGGGGGVYPPCHCLLDGESLCMVSGVGWWCVCVVVVVVCVCVCVGWGGAGRGAGASLWEGERGNTKWGCRVRWGWKLWIQAFLLGGGGCGRLLVSTAWARYPVMLRGVAPACSTLYSSACWPGRCSPAPQHARRSMRAAACAPQHALHSMRSTACAPQHALHSMHFTACASQKLSAVLPA